MMLGHGRAAAVCLGRLGDKAVAVKLRTAIELAAFCGVRVV